MPKNWAGLVLRRCHNRACGVEVFIINHHADGDEKIAAVGNARLAIKRDRIDAFGIEPTDQNIGKVAVKSSEFDKRHFNRPNRV